MKIELEMYRALCKAQEFTVNGRDADTGDFGISRDMSPETADPYCCGDRRFVGKPSTPEILEQYGITEDEYADVVSLLEDKLSWGRCGWCS